MKITTLTCLWASFVGIATAAVGCRVELLNVNQAVVGSGCVPFQSSAIIADPNYKRSYTFYATNDCGLSLEAKTFREPTRTTACLRGLCRTREPGKLPWPRSEV
ncbi:hypothetical protein BDP81DRAFT_439828 [Colletotrichum phormii]|uniref:ToxB-like N-terminal ascomycota domain-containing protein n=1 Tax=Colletotrichum phormii TaxID=359342 RepID=A0AAI9ZFC4_9PEZI|nr:uncharacterized protein BDP81DRAFT_439828 [Colletotrichum phormii]KAK1623218.1 hypothetical protein BDP81DRAFT_439828 [Colletotrichum phormii]